MQHNQEQGTVGVWNSNEGHKKECRRCFLKSFLKIDTKISPTQNSPRSFLLPPSHKWQMVRFFYHIYSLISVGMFLCWHWHWPVCTLHIGPTNYMVNTSPSWAYLPWFIMHQKIIYLFFWLNHTKIHCCKNHPEFKPLHISLKNGSYLHQIRIVF